MKTKSLQVFLVLCCLALSLSCEKEEQLNRNEESIKTVSLDQALEVMETTQQKISAKSNSNFITSISKEINYEAITNTDEQLAVIPVNTVYKNLYSRIVLLEIEGELQSAILSLNTFDSSTRDNFSGEILITDLNGHFINGLRIENNIIVSNYIQADENTNSNNLSFNIIEAKSGCENDCPFSVCSYCSLDEVVISAPRRQQITYISLADMYPQGDLNSSSFEYDYIGGGGGGSGNPDLDSDSDNENTNPCEQINEQVGNESFLDKKDELEGKTNKEKETGYVENTSGTFTELDPINGGHSLAISGIDLSNVNGFIHTHLDDFPTGRYDENTGAPEINEIFRMFSPADVIAFLRIARSSRNTNNVYATVITSTGDYTLRFTGNPTDIIGLKHPNAYRADYIDYMKRYPNLERGFLNFINDHINIDGIELYKITKPLFSSDYKIKSKTLDANGKVQTDDCE